jgi:NADH dehydrogenase ubiquinone Fe-S protein 4
MVTTARIYIPAKNAMRSLAQPQSWVLDFEQASPKTVEPLMGWTSSADVRQQVRLRFDTKEEAIAYCEQNGLRFLLPIVSPR